MKTSTLTKILLATITTCVATIQPVNAQSFSRKSLTVMIIKYNDDRPISSDYFDNLAVPTQFDENNIGLTAIGMNQSFSSAENITESDIRAQIRANRIPNRILRSILVDEKLGYMTTNLVEERGLYNATDADYHMAQNAARGISILKDAGVKLMQNIYFLIIKPSSLTSYYNSQLQSNERTYTGTGYLYQLDLDSTYMADSFWKEFYFDKPNTQMMDKLMEHDFPLKVSPQSFSVKVSDVSTTDKVGASVTTFFNTLSNSNSTNYTVSRKSESQMMEEALDKIMRSSLGSVIAGDDFSILSSVLTTHPLRAKIGKKENLRPNQLYQVTEKVLDEKTKQPLERKVGYVRVQWVGDNRVRNKMGNSEPSTFYRIATKKIEKGMLLESAVDKDRRWSMSFNYNTDTASLYSGYFANFEKLTNWLPGMSWTVDVGFNPKLRTKTVELDGNPVDGYFKGYAVSTAITFRQSFSYNHVSLIPLAGPSFSFLGLSDGNVVNTDGILLNSDNMSELYGTNVGLTLGLTYGADFGINLSKTIQLRAGVRFNNSLTPVFFDLNSLLKSKNSSDDSGSETKQSFEYTPKFKSQVYSVGIRLFNL